VAGVSPEGDYVDITKLKKKVEKAQQLRDERKTQADDALTAYGQAERALGEAQNEFEEAQALETARELRAKKQP